MVFNSAAESLSDAIKLSLAPAFLLVGITNFTNLLTSERRYLIERYRHLYLRREIGDELISAKQIHDELRVLQYRMRLTMQAISLAIISMIMISLVIGILFISVIFNIDLTIALVPLFVAAMFCLIIASFIFLVQLRISFAQARRIGVSL